MTGSILDSFSGLCVCVCACVRVWSCMALCVHCCFCLFLVDLWWMTIESASKGEQIATALQWQCMGCTCSVVKCTCVQ